ncbi:neuromedin-U [Corythoichthys intestinalis]|uniref:neuromedin-U n=1 Tax=Corythoichthys intestinalis TaxID=161448 RepID=UPI0025A5E6E9|nr:neuromedin-U [Corythoichthys intestinalis]
MLMKEKRRTASSSSCSSLTTVGRGCVSPFGVAGVCLVAILVLDSVPLIHNAPVEPWRETADQRQLLSQIAAACSSFFSADFQAPDVLGEICFLMLIQKSKSPTLHPLLQLVPNLHTRLERGLRMQAELEGPGGIQSRGYFLYRPRNGRRAIENE